MLAVRLQSVRPVGPTGLTDIVGRSLGRADQSVRRSYRVNAQLVVKTRERPYIMWMLLFKWYIISDSQVKVWGFEQSRNTPVSGLRCHSENRKR